MEKSLVRSKKKAVAPQANKLVAQQANKGNFAGYLEVKPKRMKKTVSKVNKTAHKQASSRFKQITERAKTIRDKHPRMKWKTAIKKASKELF